MIHPDHPSTRTEAASRAATVQRAVLAHCAAAGIMPRPHDEESWDHRGSDPARYAGWGDVVDGSFSYCPLRIAKNTLHLPAKAADGGGGLSAGHYLQLVLLWVTIATATRPGDRWEVFTETVNELHWEPNPLMFMFGIHAEAQDRIAGRHDGLVDDATWAMFDIDLVTPTENDPQQNAG